MMARLWQFITGYVKITVEGLKLVQFVNDAADRGIALRVAERQSYSRITAEVSWRDYRRLLALAANRPLRVAATAAGGLPQIAGLALKRLAFTLGLALCIAALAAVNGFVLDVRVTGCTMPGLEERAYSILEAQGLRPGAAKAALDLRRCERALLLGLQEISFAAIRVNGVVATVSIVEGAQPPELLDKTTPCNVVASRDAVVRKLIVYEGTPKVTAGDAVHRGQVLVNGAEASGEDIRLLHARADVMASVWYEGRGSAPLFTEERRRTGRTAQRCRLELAGYSLPAGPEGAPEFSAYETESRTYYLLGGGLKGPRLVVTTYVEVVGATEPNSFRDAMEQAFLHAMDEVNPLLPKGAEILDSRTIYGYENGAVTAKVYVETLQNIAAEQKIE